MTDKVPIRYEIEGYYPIGLVSVLMRTDPSQWERDWKVWHHTNDLRSARITLRAGNHLCHRTCPISYSRLRLVRIDKQGRKVVK